MDCPRCKVALEPANLRELGVVFNAHRCPKCDGVWTDPKQLNEIEHTVQNKFFEWRHIPSATEQMQPLACPECASHPEMNKAESSRDAKVIMDICPECHNVWLDGGEMDAIQVEGMGTVLLDYLRSFKKA